MDNSSWLLKFEASFAAYENISNYLSVSEGFLGLLEEGEQEISFSVYFDSLENAVKSGNYLKNENLITSYLVEEELPKDYNKLWKEQIEPVKICENVWVSPEWKEPTLKHGDTWIKIEPQMAFGTGHHGTTKLSAKFLVKVLQKFQNPSVIDIGTGSGVLAFIAKRFGAGYVLGVENDPTCEDNMLYNRRLNNMDSDVDFIIGDNSSVDKNKKFDICVINIIRKYSLPQLNWIYNSLNKGGMLIWSGILSDDTKICLLSAKEAGFTLLEEDTNDKWWAGVFVK